METAIYNLVNECRYNKCHFCELVNVCHSVHDFYGYVCMTKNLCLMIELDAILIGVHVYS